MRPRKGYTSRPVRAPAKPRRRYAPRGPQPVRPGSGCLSPSPAIELPRFYDLPFPDRRILERHFGLIRSVYGDPVAGPPRRPPLQFGIEYRLAMHACFGTEMPF